MDSAHCELVALLRRRPAGRRAQLPELQPAEEHRPGDRASRTRWCCYKRGFAGTIAEWLAATRLHHRRGQRQRRAVRARHPHVRDAPRASRWTSPAVPVIHKQSAATPSASTCRIPPAQRDLVPSLAYAAVAAGLRLHHDRGASQPAQGPLRRPAAAHARPVRRRWWRSCARSPPCSANESCRFRRSAERRNAPTLRSPLASNLAAIPQAHGPKGRYACAIPAIFDTKGLLADLCSTCEI